MGTPVEVESIYSDYVQSLDEYPFYDFENNLFHILIITCTCTLLSLLTTDLFFINFFLNLKNLKSQSTLFKLFYLLNNSSFYIFKYSFIQQEERQLKLNLL